MAQPTFFLQECQPWLQLPQFFAQCPNWGTQVPILKDLSQTYSSCNKNTKTTTLLLQHMGSLITVIFLHFILQEFCSGLPRLSKNKSTMWYAKRLVTITKYFFMVKIRTKQSLLGFQKWSHDFTLALRCKMSNRALPKAHRTQGIESLNFIEFFKLINESRSFYNLVMFGKGWEIHVTISYYTTIAKA